MNAASTALPRDFREVNHSTQKTEWTTDQREWYRTVYLHSPHWIELRGRKLADKPHCEICGQKARDVHHVNYRKIFDVTLGDLLSVCRKCHTELHLIFPTAKREKPKHVEDVPEHKYLYRKYGDMLSLALFELFGGECFLCHSHIRLPYVTRLNFTNPTAKLHKGVPVCLKCSVEKMTREQQEVGKWFLNNLPRERWLAAWAVTKKQRQCL